MDDLELPDNDDQTTGGLIDSLFSDRQKPKREGSAGSRRPTVRFSEPTREATPSNLPSSTFSQSNRPATSDSGTGSLFDNLFSSSLADVKRQRTQQKTASSAKVETTENASSSASAINQQSNGELEQLRKETSNLRFEKNELQQTVSELNKSQATLTENHERTIRKMRNDHQEELDRLRREHVEELKNVRTSIEDDLDVVRNVKRQEDQLITVQSRLENVTYTLNGLRDAINSMGNYNESVNRVVDLADQQINNGMSALHTEMESWERRRQSILSSVEQEIEQLNKRYSEEIVQGRKWIEAEKEHMIAQQQAFQEEQSAVLSQIEQKRAELDQYRTDFITKEHDLLVRVVNERAQLDEQRREFQRQRNADIMRMREEAEHLERCLQQIEQSHHSLERTRKDLEEKHRELDELHDQLVQHETNYWRSNQGLQ